VARNAKISLAGAAVCAAALAFLAYSVYSTGPIERLDLRIYLHFEFVPYPTIFPAETLVHLGDLIPLLAFVAVLIGIGRHFRRRRETVAALAVIVGANLSTQLLKIALESPRPAGAAGHASWAHLLPSDNAFPSGHTTAAASVAIAALFVVPARHRMTAAVAGILLTGAMAVSVVVLGWHYPTDAVGAILVAAIWGLLMAAVLCSPTRPGQTARRETPAMPGLSAASRIEARRTRSWSYD
jgi:membrane-associated phospholipid phosphatase